MFVFLLNAWLWVDVGVAQLQVSDILQISLSFQQQHMNLNDDFFVSNEIKACPRSLDEAD